MGCCISKCKPNKNSIQDINLVQDKLVIISQPPKIIPKTPIPISNKISPSPPSPTTSSTSSISSISSFTCSNHSNTTINSSSSLSSGSSSILNSKDRSFSNEFLWSCVKENPHIIRMNSIKEYSQFLVPKKLDSPIKQDLASRNQSIPQRLVKNTSTPQKRLRSNSPTPLNRTKSFRRECDRIINSSHSLPSRTLRSPSPSRRFNNGDHSCSKRIVGSNNKVNNINGANSVSSSSSLTRKESFRIRPHINSNHHNHHLRSCLKNRETFIHRISSKIDEVAVQEALAHHDSDSIPMEEDIDNPLISLDCFIFL